MFTEEHNKVILEFNLPDFSREDIDVDVKHNHIVVNAKKGGEERKEEDNLKSFEKSSSSFIYESNLPEVNPSEVKIGFERGVLKIEVPKRESGV